MVYSLIIPRLCVVLWCGAGGARTQLSNLRPLRGILHQLGGPEEVVQQQPQQQPQQFFGIQPQTQLQDVGFQEPFRSQPIPVSEDYVEALLAGVDVADALITQERTRNEVRVLQDEFPTQGFAGGVGGTDVASGPGGRLDQSGAFLFSFRRARPAAKLSASCRARLTLEASKAYLRRFNVSVGSSQESLSELNTQVDDEVCERVFPSGCDRARLPSPLPRCLTDNPYRTVDGSCNNLNNPTWGAAITPFVRFLAPAYEDGVDEMRGWGRVGDRALPSPRVVSLALQRGEQRPPLTTISLLVMQWGQFLDHDLVHTPEAAEVDETGETRPLMCCDDGVPTNNQDPAGYCRPIDVTADPLFTTNGRSCMRFVRSLLASMGCLLGPREQLNQITAYLDGSGVYGSTEEVARELREGSGGRLKTSTNPRLLPTKACEDTQGFCFKAGDERVNEQPGLTSMHTLWLRVHQRLVTNLATVNPHWDDEKLYQEGRRVVSALIQQVTYREFLPIVLGDSVMQEFRLYPHDTPTSIPTYQPTTDPSIANAFATAAYRFGHTLVSDVLRGSGDKRVPLSGNFMDPHVLVEDGSKPSDLLLGLASSPSQAADSYLVLTLSNKLFAKPEEPVGLDLMSLNIQRGRDHGLPAYTVWRRACGLSDITSFPGLAAVMNTQAAHTLSTVYRNVNDVDLFPAGLSERSVSGGLLGPTFSCILAQQFSNIKEGDRFWYQNSEQPKPFTADQLGSLTRMSLASLMCHHLNLSSLQPNPFLAASVPGNEPQPCSSYPTLDLNQWKEVTDPQPSEMRCSGVGIWQILPGMQSWCTLNCLNHFPPFCPPSHCQCYLAA